MNYKVMQRPMFKMGGKANSQGTGITSGLDEKVNMVDGRANYADGPTTYKDFLNRAMENYNLRREKMKDMDSLINLQVAAGLGKGLETETSNNPLDIALNVLRGAPSVVLPAMSAKKKLELKSLDPSTDLAFAKALKPSGGFGEKVYNMKLRQLGSLEEQQAQLREALQKGEIDQNQFDVGMSKINRRFKLISSQFKTDSDYISEARAFLESDDGPYAGASAPEDKVLEKAAEIKALESRILQADGGRVDRQMGSPMGGEQPLPEDPTKPVNPFQPKPIGPFPSKAEKMDADMETKGEGNNVYAMLRQRLPQEITDDVVKLIAYNKEAFADFASIKNQEDVSSFNEKYGVELVIDVATV